MKTKLIFWLLVVGLAVAGLVLGQQQFGPIGGGGGSSGGGTGIATNGGSGTNNVFTGAYFDGLTTNVPGSLQVFAPGSSMLLRSNTFISLVGGSSGVGSTYLELGLNTYIIFSDNEGIFSSSKNKKWFFDTTANPSNTARLFEITNTVDAIVRAQGRLTNTTIRDGTNVGSLTLGNSSGINLYDGLGFKRGQIDPGGAFKFTGTNTANAFQIDQDGNAQFLNAVKLSALSASQLLRLDSSFNVAAVTVGSGLTFDGTTLSSGPTTNAPPQTLAINSALGSTNILIDMLALGPTNTVRATLTGNVGLMFTNVIDGKDVTLEVIQDATGNRLLATNATWGFNQRWGIDITGIALTTNAGYYDLLKFHGSGTNAMASGNLRGFAP